MRGIMGEFSDVLLEQLDLEDLLREINEFSSDRSIKTEYNIPPSLEQYLRFVAKSGNIVFPWHHVRPLFRAKVMQSMEQFPGESCPSSEAFVMERFDLFRSAPFTIQRLAELVINPTRHYKKKEKFLRGLEKTVLVVSTVEPWSLDMDVTNGNDDSESDASASAPLGMMGEGDVIEQELLTGMQPEPSVFNNELDALPQGAGEEAAAASEALPKTDEPWPLDMDVSSGNESGLDVTAPEEAPTAISMSEGDVIQHEQLLIRQQPETSVFSIISIDSNALVPGEGAEVSDSSETLASETLPTTEEPWPLDMDVTNGNDSVSDAPEASAPTVISMSEAGDGDVIGEELLIRQEPSESNTDPDVPLLGAGVEVPASSETLPTTEVSAPAVSIGGGDVIEQEPLTKKQPAELSHTEPDVFVPGAGVDVDIEVSASSQPLASESLPPTDG